MRRVISLPNGERCSLPISLVQLTQDVPRLARMPFPTLDPGLGVKGWEWHPCKARDILRQLHEGDRKRASLAVRQGDDAPHGASSSAIANARCRSRCAP